MKIDPFGVNFDESRRHEYNRGETPDELIRGGGWVWPLFFGALPIFRFIRCSKAKEVFWEYAENLLCATLMLLV